MIVPPHFQQWFSSPDAVNLTVIGLVIGTSALAAERKYAHAVILGCVLAMVTINYPRYKSLEKPTGAAAAAAPAPAPADSADDVKADDNADGASDAKVDSKALVQPFVNFDAAQEYDDAVHEDLIRTDDQGLKLDEAAVHARTVLETESNSLTGQSKYIFDQKFTPTKYQVHQPVISTTFDEKVNDAYEKQPTAKGLQELLARQSFYDSIASGGDMNPRMNPGLKTMAYLTASANQ